MAGKVKSKKVISKRVEDALNLILSDSLYEKANVDDNINITTGMSVTINIGNYESVKYTVNAGMLCKHKYAKEVKEELDKYVESEIKKKYEEIKSNSIDNTDIVESNIDLEDDKTIEIDF